MTETRPAQVVSSIVTLQGVRGTHSYTAGTAADFRGSWVDLSLPFLPQILWK